MTLEDLINNLNNDNLDLEIKIHSLCDFYFHTNSFEENARIIANLHDNYQIDLIKFIDQIINSIEKKELIDIDHFEHVFFNIIVSINELNFSKLINIVLKLDEILKRDQMRFEYLKKVAQKNSFYAEYLFNFIVSSLDVHYDKLGLAISCLTVFKPTTTKDFIINHFNLEEKNLDFLLNAVGYMNYPSPDDALEILDTINNLINNNELNSSHFSQILEIITYIYLQHVNLENDVINTIELISSKINPTDISEKAASLLFLNRASLSKNLKQHFYQIIINAESISHQICNNLGLTIQSQSNDEDIIKLIEIIEQLLVRHENISINYFHTYYICENSDLLNKIVTQWLLTKKKKLWKSASIIISSNQIKSLHVDTSWVNNFKEEDYIFLTKKAIGWFHAYEELVLKFIISILKLVKESELVNQILNLTFQHVIINYEPQHVALFFDLKNYTDEEMRNKIKELKVQHETLYNDIEQATMLKELICPLENSRLLQYKKHHDNEKINKSANEQSVFSDIFARKIMLYGDKFIHASIAENKEEVIQETELSSFSYTLTLPLQYFTDPILLEYQKLIFMNEGME